MATGFVGSTKSFPFSFDVDVEEEEEQGRATPRLSKRIGKLPTIWQNIVYVRGLIARRVSILCGKVKYIFFM